MSKKAANNRKSKAGTKVEAMDIEEPIQQTMQQPLQEPMQIQQKPLYVPPQQMQANMLPPQMMMPNMQQNSNAMPRTRQAVGGMYGNRTQQPANEPDIYNDDEMLIEKVKEIKVEDAKVEIEIKAQRTMIKLKEETIMPAMCSVKASGGAKSNVDLICVIDVSGSMSGEKIGLVRDTMKFLLETLTPADRLSIITFSNSGTRINGLKSVTPENMIMLSENIHNLRSGGGTNINSGLNLALKTIRERKFKNSVTSVFLLSDGQDQRADQTFKNTLKEQQNQELGVFSIHSFGFGTDHDEDLMTKLCGVKDGSFYFIKELATLDEAFCNALGGIISIVATDVTIKVSNISKNLMEGSKILRTFGEMWERISDNEYKIKILQLMSGVSKDYVFEMGFPNIDAEVGDINRDHDVMEAIFIAKGVKGDNISGECVLKMTLLNQNEQIPEVNENVDVIENYLRIQATYAIEANMKLAEKADYEGAQKGIDDMIHVIQNNKRARKDKMEVLVQDLQHIRSKCSKQDYACQGKKWMKSAQVAHQMQSNYAYSNSVQQEMVNVQKMKKKM